MLVFDHLFLVPFSACHVCFFSQISSLFPPQCPCDKIFLLVSIDSIRSVQEIFVHATYVPFHQLPSVGVSVFVRKFLYTRCTCHFTNYQVWGFPVFQEIFVHATYVPAQLTILGLAQARPNYELIFTKINFHWKSDLFTKILYYENLKPYGIRSYQCDE